jgi:hypothetical protein
VRQAEILLRTEKFALVIVSAFLSQAERERVVSAAGETPTLVLEGLTFAPQLLPQVERLLQPTHLNL